MSKSVLIVEDNADISKLIKGYVTNMGCFKHVITANDGMMASIKLKNQKFDIIFMDIEMPKKDGDEVIRELSVDKRALNKPEDIVVISGSLDKEMLSKLIGIGVKNFIAKPFDEADFQEKALKILGTKKA